MITYNIEQHKRKENLYVYSCDYSLYSKPSWEMWVSMEHSSLLVRQNILLRVRIASDPQPAFVSRGT